MLLGVLPAGAQYEVRDESSSGTTSSNDSKLTPKSESQRAAEAKARQQQADAQKRRYQKMARQSEARAAANGKPVPTPIPKAEPVKPDTFVGWMKNSNWQRWAEIRSGNVILLRRSTNKPAAPNETVILRWRTPNEHARRAGLSSKGSFPNRPIGPQKEWFERIAAGEDE